MLLAVDTSTPTLGIALYNAPQVLGEMIWLSKSHHTVELAPAVQLLMQRCSVKPLELECLAVALGPGSFTSLRIGMAFVKGLALSLNIPLIGIPTFEYLAEAQPLVEHPMIVTLPAGRSRLAVQWYGCTGNKWIATSSPQVMTPEEVSEGIHEPTIICGELSAADRQVVGRKWKNAILNSPALSIRRPSLLAEMAWDRWKSGSVDDPVTLAPIYLHVVEAIPA